LESIHGDRRRLRRGRPAPGYPPFRERDGVCYTLLGLKILTDLGSLSVALCSLCAYRCAGLDLDWTVFFCWLALGYHTGWIMYSCSRSTQPAYMRLKWRRIFVIHSGSRAKRFQQKTSKFLSEALVYATETQGRLWFLCTAYSFATRIAGNATNKATNRRSGTRNRRRKIRIPLSSRYPSRATQRVKHK
jgi:hypothetical protein